MLFINVRLIVTVLACHNLQPAIRLQLSYLDQPCFWESAALLGCYVVHASQLAVCCVKLLVAATA